MKEKRSVSKCKGKMCFMKEKLQKQEEKKNSYLKIQVFIQSDEKFLKKKSKAYKKIIPVLRSLQLTFIYTV